MIKTLFDTGAANSIPANVDGSIYQLISDDCVVDLTNKFGITYSGRTATFASGAIAYIGGAYFWLKESESITLPANSTIYLVARIDPTQPNNSRGSITYVSTESAVQKGNVNNGQVRDLLLYKITTSSNSVLSTIDRRVIRGKGSSVSGYGIWVGTQSEYNALTKDNNTLYFIKE